jgi:hypothetical protein
MVGVISAAALPLGAAGSAAAEPSIPTAHSYADLLQPIPNAVERLKASDAEGVPGGAHLIKAQYHHHHHHHHHHSHYYTYPSYDYYGPSYSYTTPSYGSYNNGYYATPYYGNSYSRSYSYRYDRRRSYRRHHHHHHSNY